MDTREMIAAWFRNKPFIAYRIKKSVVKRLLPKILEDYPFEQDFFGLLYKGNAANYIDRIVFLCGAYEKFMLYFMRDMVSAFSLEDCVFLDVGANVGNHTLYMSRIVKQVHAFEPYNAVLNKLREKIRINNIKNVSIHPFGLSNNITEIPFYLPQGGNLGTGSFSPDFKNGGDLYKPLPVITGDIFIHENGITDIGIIKIDVEGHERQVLEGLAETISRQRPVVVFEMSPETVQGFRSEHEFSETFPDEYTFLRFTKADRDNGAYRLGKYVFATNYRNQDVIAVPAEKYSLLKNTPGVFA